MGADLIVVPRGFCVYHWLKISGGQLDACLWFAEYFILLIVSVSYSPYEILPLSPKVPTSLLVFLTGHCSV